MFEYNAQDNYRLRLHRARSVILTNDELVEMRAAQRTFEGAYVRTALGQFSFSLYVLYSTTYSLSTSSLSPTIPLKPYASMS